MNRPVRLLATAVLSALALLAAGLTYQQAAAGPGYRDDLRNPRAFIERQRLERGPIVTADGMVVARSQPGPGSSQDLVRTYPEGALYAHSVGYASSFFGDTGVERSRADDLRSPDDGSLTAALISLFGGDLRPRAVQLTLRDDLQRAADRALGDRRGAVVAIDPATGAVLAMVSHPSFDPNLLATGSAAQGDALAADPTRPLLNRALSATYPPGSSFKVLVAAAGLEASYVTPDTPLPDTDELELPGSTATIHNFDGGVCNDGRSITLERALAVSCNTAFARLGMLLGAEAVVGAAEAAGFNGEIPFELEVAPSALPEAGELAHDPPALAQTSLGQRDVRATPLQMALVAAAVANRGIIMRPYLVDALLDADGETVTRTEPRAWLPAFATDTAADLAAIMEQVVAGGTGWRAALPGIRVGGKTGTAEVPGSAPHAWFIAFAPVEAAPGEPQIALAVLVESGGQGGDEGTGGSVAAPIARAVLETFFYP